MDGEERAEYLKEMESENHVPSEIAITAQLNHRNYNSVVSGEMAVEVPAGVHFFNKAGSRTLEFVCEDEKIAEELIYGLEASGIPWDEEYASEEFKL